MIRSLLRSAVDRLAPGLADLFDEPVKPTPRAPVDVAIRWDIGDEDVILARSSRAFREALESAAERNPRPANDGRTMSAADVNALAARLVDLSHDWHPVRVHLPILDVTFEVHGADACACGAHRRREGGVTRYATEPGRWDEVCPGCG